MTDSIERKKNLYEFRDMSVSNMAFMSLVTAVTVTECDYFSILFQRQSCLIASQRIAHSPLIFYL